MPNLTPVASARALGLGRVAFGAALLVAPDRIGRSWLGEEGATPAAQVALRALGTRDALIGMAIVHTAADPDRGHRWARTSALGDLTDLVATFAARRALPASGVASGVVMAGATGITSLVISRRLRGGR